jgi:hypothetical protein
MLLFALLSIPNALRTEEYLGIVAPFGNGWLTKIQHRSGAREIEITIGDEVWGFVSPSATTRPLEPLSPWAIRRAWQPTRISLSINAKHGERDWEEAFRRMEITPREIALQLVENVVLILFAPSWPDGSHSRMGWFACVLFKMDVGASHLRGARVQL